MVFVIWCLQRGVRLAGFCLLNHACWVGFSCLGSLGGQGRGVTRCFFGGINWVGWVSLVYWMELAWLVLLVKVCWAGFAESSLLGQVCWFRFDGSGFLVQVFGVWYVG